MTPEETAELVRLLEDAAIRDAGMASQASDLRWRAAKAIVSQQKQIESLQASVTNAESGYEAAETRNEFLVSVIEAIEQAAKEAKELPE